MAIFEATKTQWCLNQRKFKADSLHVFRFEIRSLITEKSTSEICQQKPSIKVSSSNVNSPDGLGTAKRALLLSPERPRPHHRALWPLLSCKKVIRISNEGCKNCKKGLPTCLPSAHLLAHSPTFAQLPTLLLPSVCCAVPTLQYKQPAI